MLAIGAGGSARRAPFAPLGPALRRPDPRRGRRVRLMVSINFSYDQITRLRFLFIEATC